MRRVSVIVSLLLLSCFTLLSCSTTQKVQQVSSQWTVLGQIEWAQAETAFVVARETSGAHRVIVGLHELIEISKRDDGSIQRTYREEPCVLFVDDDGDHVMTPKDRRWKMPNDHVCPIALAKLTLKIDINDTAKTINLTVAGQSDARQPASFSASLDPHTVQQSQLPGIP